MYDVKMVKLSAIRADPAQPRKTFSQESIAELAESIKQHGVIKNLEIDEHGILICGENRLRACLLLGMEEVPCRVIVGLPKDERFLRQLHENLKVAAMTPVDIAKAIATLQASGKSLAQIAKDLGKGRNWASYMLSILAMPEDVQDRINCGEVSVTAIAVWHTIEGLEQEGVIAQGVSHDFASKAHLMNEAVARGIMTAIRSNPGSAKQYLGVELSKERSSADILRDIAAIAPTVGMQMGRSNQVVKGFIRIIRAATTQVRLHRPRDFGSQHGNMVKAAQALHEALSIWLHEASL